MTEGQLKGFIARLKEDAELRAMLSASDADPVANAKVAGFAISADNHYHLALSMGQSWVK